jgi:hypothetical protein
MMHDGWIVAATIIVPVWGVTILGWAILTGVLTDHGILQMRRRAAAQLVILPVIAAIIPSAMVINLIFIGDSLYLGNASSTETWRIVGGNAIVGAMILGCRIVARWIAADAGRSTPYPNESAV